MAVLYGRQAAVDGLWSTRHTAPMGQRKGLHAQAHAQQRCVGSVAKDIQAHTCGVMLMVGCVATTAVNIPMSAGLQGEPGPGEMTMLSTSGSHVRSCLQLSSSLRMTVGATAGFQQGTTLVVDDTQ